MAAIQADTPAGQQVLSASTQRFLGDSKAELRRKAASEIADLVKGYSRDVRDGENNMVQLVKLLDTQYVSNAQATHRKGGLLGLSTVATSFFSQLSGELIEKYVPLLAMPTLQCFADVDASVRFAACETMFNIVKVSRVQILQSCFSNIFLAMVNLAADPETRVRNANHELYSLVRDVVGEAPPQRFSVEEFVVLVEENLSSTNPYVRHHLMSWIEAVDSIPHIHLIHYFCRFAHRLFMLLGDPNDAIVKMAQGLLVRFLEDLRTHHREALTTAELGNMIQMVLALAESSHMLVREAVVLWTLHLIAIGEQKALPFAHRIARGILPCISAKEESIRAAAVKVDETLGSMISEFLANAQEDGEWMRNKGNPPMVAAAGQENDMVDVDHCQPSTELLLKEVIGVLSRPEVPTRLAALNWIKMINQSKPRLLDEHFDLMFHGIVQTLGDPSIDVVSCAVSVIATVCTTGDQQLHQEHLDKFATSLLVVLEENDHALLSRAGYIFKLLCVEVGGVMTYTTIARLLVDIQNKQFVVLLVTTLHTLLLTAQEVLPLREALRATGTKGEVFQTLYSSWSHNVVATIALCFLARGYSLAYRLVVLCGDMELSVHTLFQLDRLIQLIESPVLTFLRMALLDPKKNIYLVKALFGILMLIPQSHAYEQLSKRLAPVSCISTLPCNDEQSSSKKEKTPQREMTQEEEQKLVATFSKTQEAVEEYYQKTTDVEQQFEVKQL